jgi:hypothetical protein
MTDQQHRATAGEWASVKSCANDVVTYSCILELLHRIEALEAAQPAKPNHPAKPDGSLVERVRQAQGCGNERDARAAIREVSAWLRENPNVYFPTDLVFVLLEKEAEQ